MSQIHDTTSAMSAEVLLLPILWWLVMTRQRLRPRPRPRRIQRLSPILGRYNWWRTHPPWNAKWTPYRPRTSRLRQWRGWWWKMSPLDKAITVIRKVLMGRDWAQRWARMQPRSRWRGVVGHGGRRMHAQGRASCRTPRRIMANRQGSLITPERSHTPRRHVIRRTILICWWRRPDQFRPGREGR